MQGPGGADTSADVAEQALGSARMIKKLRTEIAEIRKEAAPLNNPSTFAKHAKLERQAAAKEKEMEKLKAEWESPKHKMMQKIPLLTRLAVWTWVLYIQGKVPVIQLGKKAAWPIGPLLSFPYGGDWMGGGAVSCVFWLSLCHKFSSMLVRAALPQ